MTVYSFEKFFEERFRKLSSVFVRNSVDGRPNCRNKASFSVFSADRGFVSVQPRSQPTQGPRVHARPRRLPKNKVLRFQVSFTDIKIDLIGFRMKRNLINLLVFSDTKKRFNYKAL